MYKLKQIKLKETIGYIKNNNNNKIYINILFFNIIKKIRKKE